MGQDTRIIHLKVSNGKPEDVEAVRDAVQELKKKLDFDVEFLITNDVIELTDVRTMIKELMILYKLDKKQKEKKK